MFCRGHPVIMFCRGHPVVFIRFKTAKRFLVSVKQNNMLFYFNLMTTFFGHLTIIRPSLQIELYVFHLEVFSKAIYGLNVTG